MHIHAHSDTQENIYSAKYVNKWNLFYDMVGIFTIMIMCISICTMIAYFEAGTHFGELLNCFIVCIGKRK